MIEIAIFIMVWSVTLVRGKTIWITRAWRTNRIGFNLWLTTVFFAITVTFLVEPIAVPFDALTWNNFSRLIAYSAALLTLHFTLATSVETLNEPFYLLIFRLTRPLLLLALVLLAMIYAVFIANTPQWIDHHVPLSAPEASFMLTLYFTALLLCLILVAANLRFAAAEQATLNRMRIGLIVMTAILATLYFLVKLILVFGYYYQALNSPWLVELSIWLLLSTAFSWSLAFISNRLYLRILDAVRLARAWLTYNDLDVLLRYLDSVCPPVAIIDPNPSIIKFLQNSDYYLYRSVVRILDGKTMLADFLSSADPLQSPAWRSTHEQVRATQIYTALNQVADGDDYWDLIQAYRQVSRRLNQRSQSTLMGWLHP